MNIKLRKLLAFEWLMLVVFGFFWGSGMFFYLFITEALSNSNNLGRNCLLIFGPYMVCFIIRVFYLIYRSLRWAYLVSSFLFSSEKERRFAQEWALFVLLFFVWSLMMAYPLYRNGVFSEKAWPLAVAIMAAPYVLFVASRWIFGLLVLAWNTLNKR